MIIQGFKNQRKDMLEENIEDMVKAHTLMQEVYKKYK